MDNYNLSVSKNIGEVIGLCNAFDGTCSPQVFFQIFRKKTLNQAGVTIDGVLSDSMYYKCARQTYELNAVAKKACASTFDVRDTNDQQILSCLKKLKEFETLSNEFTKQTTEIIDKINKGIQAAAYNALLMSLKDGKYNDINSLPFTDNKGKYNSINSTPFTNNKGYTPLSRGGRRGFDPIGMFCVGPLGVLLTAIGCVAGIAEERKLDKELERKKEAILIEKNKWIIGKITEMTLELDKINGQVRSLKSMYKNIANRLVDFECVKNGCGLKSFDNCFTLYVRTIFVQQKIRHLIENLIEILLGRQQNIENFGKNMGYYIESEINKWPDVVFGYGINTTANWNSRVASLIMTKTGKYPLVMYKTIF